MKIGNILHEGKVIAAVLTKDGVTPISWIGGIPERAKKMSTDDILMNPDIFRILQDAGDSDTADFNALAEPMYAPVVLMPQKILCIGLNYRSHVEETNDRIPDTPVIFSKYTNSLAASGQAIPIPKETAQLDYEGELGIVIGKKGKDIAQKNAADHIFGYFVGNDLSARDLQFRTSQWLLGKSCDYFYPCGPFITTADEITDPQKLDIRTHVNGEVRQNSNTSYMIFSCSLSLIMAFVVCGSTVIKRFTP